MLYVFLEGPDDERFFSKVMAALLGECHYVLYANMPNSKVNNYIKSIDQTPTSDYIFLVDGDGKSIAAGSTSDQRCSQCPVLQKAQRSDS